MLAGKPCESGFLTLAAPPAPTPSLLRTSTRRTGQAKSSQGPNLQKAKAKGRKKKKKKRKKREKEGKKKKKQIIGAERT